MSATLGPQPQGMHVGVWSLITCGYPSWRHVAFFFSSRLKVNFSFCSTSSFKLRELWSLMRILLILVSLP